MTLERLIPTMAISSPLKSAYAPMRITMAIISISINSNKTYEFFDKLNDVLEYHD